MPYRLLVVILLVSLVGCGEKTRPTVAIKGAVSLDGKPVEDGVIFFEPKDGKGTVTTAQISDGNYEIQVEPGVKTIRINYPKVIRSEPIYKGTPNSAMMDVTEEQIPAKYNSATTLEKDLSKAADDIDFKLTTK